MNHLDGQVVKIPVHQWESGFPIGMLLFGWMVTVWQLRPDGLCFRPTERERTERAWRHLKGYYEADVGQQSLERNYSYGEVGKGDVGNEYIR